MQYLGWYLFVIMFVWFFWRQHFDSERKQKIKAKLHVKHLMPSEDELRFAQFAFAQQAWRAQSNREPTEAEMEKHKDVGRVARDWWLAYMEKRLTRLLKESGL